MNSNYRNVELPGGNWILFPRVSRILSVINKPGLNDWRANMGREASDQIAQEARDIGSEIHRLVAGLIRQEAIPKIDWELLSEEIKNGISAYIRYLRTSQFTPQIAECTVYSLKYKYAGTIDAVGPFKDSVFGIVDWKCNDSVWDEYIIQVAAYFVAWNEQHPNNQVDCARVVNLDRNTGKPNETIISRDEALYAFKYAFLPARTIFHYLERNGRHIAQNSTQESKRKTAQAAV